MMNSGSLSSRLTNHDNRSPHYVTVRQESEIPMKMTISNVMTTLIIILLMAPLAIAGSHECSKHMKADDSASCCKAMNFSTEQMAKIKEIKTASDTEIQPLRATLEEKKAALLTAINSNAQQQDLDKIVEEMGQVKGQIQKVRLGKLLQIRQMLNDEQKQLFGTTFMDCFMHGGHDCAGCNHARADEKGCSKHQMQETTKSTGCSKPCTLPEKDNCKNKAVAS